MKQILAIVMCALAFLAFSAFGHGDEDHGAPPPVVHQHQEPRVTAVTDQFEIVVSREGKQWLLYVDRFASNEPVTNAIVEVEGAGLKGIAHEIAPGTYVIDVAASLPAARHPLMIGIEAGDSTDLLSVTLDTSLWVTSRESVDGWSERIVWIVAGLLLLTAGAAFAARRRKKTNGIT